MLLCRPNKQLNTNNNRIQCDYCTVGHHCKTDPDKHFVCVVWARDIVEEPGKGIPVCAGNVAVFIVMPQYQVNTKSRVLALFYIVHCKVHLRAPISARMKMRSDKKT